MEADNLREYFIGDCYRFDDGAACTLGIVKLKPYDGPPVMTVIDLETQLAEAEDLVRIATQAYSKASNEFDNWKETDEKAKRNSPVGPFNQPFYEAHTQLNDSNRELNVKKARMAAIQDKLNELKQSQNESSAQQTPHKLRRWLFPAKALRNDVMRDRISLAQYAVRAEEYNMWVG